MVSNKSYRTKRKKDKIWYIVIASVLVVIAISSLGVYKHYMNQKMELDVIIIEN